MIKSDPTLSLDATKYPSFIQVKNAMKRRAVDQNSMGAILEAVECYKIEDISFETEEGWCKPFVLRKSSLLPGPENENTGRIHWFVKNCLEEEEEEAIPARPRREATLRYTKDGKRMGEGRGQQADVGNFIR
jgi:hypothetical protein